MPHVTFHLKLAVFGFPAIDKLFVDKISEHVIEAGRFGRKTFKKVSTSSFHRTHRLSRALLHLPFNYFNIAPGESRFKGRF